MKRETSFFALSKSNAHNIVIYVAMLGSVITALTHLYFRRFWNHAAKKLDGRKVTNLNSEMERAVSLKMKKQMKLVFRGRHKWSGYMLA